MEHFALIIVVTFLALFALLVLWMIAQERKRAQRKRQRAEALGFHPLEKPDPLLVEQVLALHRRKPLPGR